MVRMADIIKKKTKSGNGGPSKAEHRKKAGEKEISQEHGVQLAGAMKGSGILKNSIEKPKEPGVQFAKGEAKVDKEMCRKLYDEALQVIRTTLEKGTRGEPIDVKVVVEIVAKIVDQMLIDSSEMLKLSCRSTPENYLFAHSVNVCILAIQVGLGLEYNKLELNRLGLAACLHDIGMGKVSKIVQRPEKLTTQEYEEVKKHPIYGVEILESIKEITKSAILAAAEHHERVGGQGYPKGIKESSIEDYSQLIGIVDTYEAMTHPRPYRKKKISPHLAMKKIIEQAKDSFSGRILKSMIGQMGIYPIDCWVRLNTDEVGMVVDANEGSPLRPIIEIIIDSHGDRLEEPKLINLVKDHSLYIKGHVEEDELKLKSSKIDLKGGD